MTVSFNLAPGTSLGDAVNAIDQALSTLGSAHRPSSTAFQGTAQAFRIIAVELSRIAR